MAYDPSGDTKLEGKDIIRLLAEGLGVDKKDLKEALVKLVDEHAANLTAKLLEK